MSILKECFIKEEKFKPQALGGKKEITIRQLSIDENEKFREIRNEGTHKDAIHYAVKCSMVDPVFFTDEELKNLNIVGENLIMQIYYEIPLIGMTKKERDAYFKNIEELAKKMEEKKDEEPSEEEVEKK